MTQCSARNITINFVKRISAYRRVRRLNHRSDRDLLLVELYGILCTYDIPQLLRHYPCKSPCVYNGAEYRRRYGITSIAIPHAFLSWLAPRWLSTDLNTFKRHIRARDSHPKFYHVTRVPYLWWRFKEYVSMCIARGWERERRGKRNLRVSNVNAENLPE